MSMLVNDVKYGIRQLVKNPGSTLIVILTLTIGIGANTTMFSVVNAVLLRPLPYPDAGRLVMLWETEPEQGQFHTPVSIPNFLDWQKRSRSFDHMGLAYNCPRMNFALDESTCHVEGAAVSSGLFSALGVKPLLGRTFTTQEDRPSSDVVMVLSYDLWQNQFAADPHIIGRQIAVEGGFLQSTVVGVLPASFQPFHESFQDEQCWLSLGTVKFLFNQRGNRGANVVAKLKPDVTLEQAQSEMDGIATRMATEYGENRDRGISLVPLLKETIKDVDTTMWVLLAAVGFLLLIVCVNVANLLLARVSSREREIAVRAALGAGPWRLIRQVFVESLLLAILGGASGFSLASCGNKLLHLWLEGHIPRMHDLSMDARVLGFTVLVSLSSCIVFGLAPALRLLGCEVLPTLQRSAGRSTSSRYRVLQDALVVTQIALALVLLVGAGLLGRSFVSLTRTDLGMKPENVLTFSLGLPVMQYQDSHKRSTLLTRLDNELQTLPGVCAAGSTNLLPFTTWNSAGFSVKEGVPTHAGIQRMARYQAVSPDYFKTIGTKLVKGRFFNEHDVRGTAGKIVINEAMARRFWPNDDPIGTHLALSISYGDGAPASYEIVGIVADAKQQTVQAEIQPEMSWLNAQHPAFGVVYTVRSEIEPVSLTKSIRDVVARLDETVTIFDVRTLQERIGDTFTRERFSLSLYSLLSVVALLLASFGVYGVVAYAVNTRQQEIGIRFTLGAQRRDVLAMILKKGCLLAGAGTAIGILAAMAVTRLMASMLYQVTPFDPMTFAMVPLLLIAVALLACFVPARRATKIDPMKALRYE